MFTAEMKLNDKMILAVMRRFYPLGKFCQDPIFKVYRLLQSQLSQQAATAILISHRWGRGWGTILTLMGEQSDRVSIQCNCCCCFIFKYILAVVDTLYFTNKLLKYRVS